MVLCIVYTVFTNVTNLWNIFLIFYDHLDIFYFTIFGSIKFAVENFITSTLYSTKSVNYLKDATISIKEFFQIRLTLISNSSDCENMIALFVFSFILLRLCYHTKEIWGWKLVYQQSSHSLVFPIFLQKIPEFISWEYPKEHYYFRILDIWIH